MSTVQNTIICGGEEKNTKGHDNKNRENGGISRVPGDQCLDIAQERSKGVLFNWGHQYTDLVSVRVDNLKTGAKRNKSGVRLANQGMVRERNAGLGGTLHDLGVGLKKCGWNGFGCCLGMEKNQDQPSLSQGNYSRPRLMYPEQKTDLRGKVSHVSAEKMGGC